MIKTMVFVLTFCLYSCNTHKKVKTDFEVTKNETFDITLNSNPTTGYSWKWIKNSSSKIVDSVSSNYQSDKTSSGIVGVGGKEIWKFKGKNTGIDTLTFEYCRSWDAKSTVETKKIIVKIN